MNIIINVTCLIIDVYMTYIIYSDRNAKKV